MLCPSPDIPGGYSLSPLISFFYNLYIGNLNLDDEVPIDKLENRVLPVEGIFFTDMDSDKYG